MNAHNTKNNEDNKIIENFKEEGTITVETIEIVNGGNIDDLSKKHHRRGFTLTTPVAIIIASVVIAFGLMGYGFITTNGGGNTSSTASPLPAILKSVGVNKSAFIKCVDSGEKAQAVTDSVNDGVKAGVNGTPATFILREEAGIFYVVNNISGAQDENIFRQSIEEAINLTNFKKLAKFEGKIIDQNELQEVTNPTKVYVVEYSDAECPFCTRLHPTIKKIRTDYAGRISYVYRNFPLPPSLHPHAQKEAEMISCVGKLGGAKAYYPFIDALFDYKIKNNAPYIPYTPSK
ncbi:MAG: thioredoxin domain-containing protein [Candidatus Nomurabacteria bacterium]|nr:thioredoxin domain-containing protein [Candidatus Nomurabacteria bacterium]